MITIYTKDNCQYCDRAKAFLDIHKVPYTAWNIEYSPDAREFLKSKGHKTVPQLYLDEDTLAVEGGYDGLTRLSLEQIAHLKGL